MSPDLELQKAIRSKLISSPTVSALVPAASILDRHERPAPRPSIILGQSQMVDEGTSMKRRHHRIYHDLHVWVKEPSTEQAKGIAWAIRQALQAERLPLSAGLHLADLRVESQRLLRDPDMESSHAILTVNALVVEVFL